MPACSKEWEDNSINSSRIHRGGVDSRRSRAGSTAGSSVAAAEGVLVSRFCFTDSKRMEGADLGIVRSSRRRRGRLPSGWYSEREVRLTRTALSYFRGSRNRSRRQKRLRLDWPCHD